MLGGLRARLRRNVLLKLVSLALAVMLYLLVNSRDRAPRRAPVPGAAVPTARAAETSTARPSP